MSRVRGRSFVWLLGLPLALALSLNLACTSTARLKVLCFFFDGVPGDPAAVDDRVTSDTRHSILPRPASTPAPTPLPIVSVHQPVEQNQCGDCHESARGFEPIAINAQMCDRCHQEQRQREGWNHGPINLGTCVPCHRAHESQYPHLLDRPVPELCQVCHAEDMKRNAPHHQAPNLNECTACHDPHRSDKQG